MSPRREWVLLVSILLLPRLLRIAWPQVWLEDADYVHAGLLVSRGFVPFRDFVSPHFPFLEALLGGLFVVAGPSLRAAELMTQAAVVGAAFFLYRAVRARNGAVPALLAAALYGCSSLIFRYHLFEREIFTNLFLAAGLCFVMEGRHRGRRGAALLGVLALGAGLVKLTALADWAAVGVYLFLDRTRRRAAAWFLGVAALGMLAMVSAGVVLFGDSFVAEVFLFHTLKGGTARFGEHLGMLRRSLDIAGILGFGGLVFLLIRGFAGRFSGVFPLSGGEGRASGKTSRPEPLSSDAGGRFPPETVLIVLLLGVRLVFFLFFSPTFWPHNAIPLLVPLSWAGGIFVAWAGGLAFDFVRRPGMRGAAPMAAAAAWLVLGFFIFPLRNDQWRFGSVYGFGFQDRGEIARIAGAVREHSGPDERIVAPPAVAVEAGRVKLVHYREVAGPVAVIREAMDRGRLGELRANLRDAGFFDTLFRSSRVVGETIEVAIRARAVPVVVPDSRFSLVSETRVREPFLEGQGYREVLATEHYTVWTLAEQDRASPAR